MVKTLTNEQVWGTKHHNAINHLLFYISCLKSIMSKEIMYDNEIVNL